MNQIAVFRIVTPAGNYWGIRRGTTEEYRFIGTPADSMNDGLYDKPIELEFHGSFVVEYLNPGVIVKCTE